MFVVNNNYIPTDALGHIFSFMSDEDLGENVQLTCHYFKNILDAHTDFIPDYKIRKEYITFQYQFQDTIQIRHLKNSELMELNQSYTKTAARLQNIHQDSVNFLLSKIQKRTPWVLVILPIKKVVNSHIHQQQEQENFLIDHLTRLNYVENKEQLVKKIKKLDEQTNQLELALKMSPYIQLKIFQTNSMIMDLVGGVDQFNKIPLINAKDLKITSFIRIIHKDLQKSLSNKTEEMRITQFKNRLCEKTCESLKRGVDCKGRQFIIFNGNDRSHVLYSRGETSRTWLISIKSSSSQSTNELIVRGKIKKKDLYTSIKNLFETNFADPSDISHNF